ncbi:MAG: endolytic transglycosylase MltG [Candidatus Methylomirabilales bacterium]
MHVRGLRFAPWVAGLGLVLITAFGVRTYLALYPTMRPRYRDTGPRVVDIKPNTGSAAIADLLGERGIIQDRFLFILFTTVRGSSDALKAGEYEFSSSMGLLDIIRILERGRVLVHKVTIPEGSSVWQIAALLDADGLVDKQRFLELAMDPSMASFYVPGANTLEGFLFPDTYHFIKGIDGEEVIETIVQRFFREITREDERRARELGMSLYEIVTLASIIEKEAVIDREKPIIAGVFYNRLRRGMRLQADPTVLYGRRRQGRIRRRDLRADHPYNTYVQNGLPPGPIANPGAAALKAALYPARVSYLYFVSKNDGTHHFSRTLREHQRAVRKYQIRPQLANPKSRSI